ncbi:MAG TPA: DUF4136 domain-containing protein [Bacteroidales bacterium]|nr:DUF4136 domain-containing protein [Bacteroidales bacterium]
MKKNVFYFIGILFLMISCYPEGIEYYEETDIVFTDYTESFDFASRGTYSMPDKIVKITGNLVEGEDPEFVPEPYNTQILNKIESNMTAQGWTKIADPESADLALLPAVWSNTTIVYYYDYWCWYYYYYCGWGWYYPYATSYTTGTMVMTLVAHGEEYIEPSTVWTAAINGLMSGAYDTSRITKAIDQAFKQSPYLNTK